MSDDGDKNQFDFCHRARQNEHDSISERKVKAAEPGLNIHVERQDNWSRQLWKATFPPGNKCKLT